MSRKSLTYLRQQGEATAGEILVGITWGVLYVALIAFGLGRDALVLLAERGLSAVF